MTSEQHIAERAASVDTLPFTIIQEGSITAVTYTSGSHQSKTFRVDIPKLRRQWEEKRRLGREETPEEDLPRFSSHAFGQQISEEEYYAVEALEKFHVAHGTLHELYPEIYSEGYVLENDDDGSDGDGVDEDEDPGRQADGRRGAS